MSEVPSPYKPIGDGLEWIGFFLMLGLINFGRCSESDIVEMLKSSKAQEEVDGHIEPLPSRPDTAPGTGSNADGTSPELDAL